MGPPFSDYQRHLNDTYDEISGEVEDYYLSEEGDEIEMPDAYWWLIKTDSYGLLFPGSYVQQPCFFMRAIEAARAGRTRAEVAISKNQAAQSPGTIRDIAEQLGGGIRYGT
jgi:hypothetical protein